MKLGFFLKEIFKLLGFSESDIGWMFFNLFLSKLKFEVYDVKLFIFEEVFLLFDFIGKFVIKFLDVFVVLESFDESELLECDVEDQIYEFEEGEVDEEEEEYDEEELEGSGVDVIKEFSLIVGGFESYIFGIIFYGFFDGGMIGSVFLIILRFEVN